MAERGQSSGGGTGTHAEALDLTGSLLSGRYRLDRLLGRGGMGEVYQARDSLLSDRVVAVKILREKATVQWFKREFETVSQMDHVNIASVFDFSHDADRDLHFYTCELVAGRPADEALDGSPFREKMHVFVQVLRALHAIHGHGYLHCDVKPGNVLVEHLPDGTSQARVLDFGLAMAKPRAAMAGRGTPYYMAPEWFEEGIPGAYTDLYSAGIMFYQITYGRLPFSAADSRSCIEFHTRGRMEFPDHPDVPVWWQKVLAQMTSREVADRFHSARDCLAAINRLAGTDFPLYPPGEEDRTAVGGPWIARPTGLRDALDLLERVRQRELSQGTMLIVRGGSGVGKSRLLAELKRRIQLAGETVILVAPPAGGASAFGPLASQLEAAAGLSQEVPQDRVGHRVSRLIERTFRMALQQHVVLLVDDVAGLDEHSAQFLSGLARSVEYALANEERCPRISMVAAAADPDAGFLKGLEVPRCRRDVELPPLDRAGVERLVKLVLGVAEVPAALLEEGWTASQGKPRLVLEFLVCLRARGLLAYTHAGIAFDRERLSAKGLPAGVEQYLSESWRGLPAAERQLLKVITLLFSPQPAAVVAAVAGLSVPQAVPVLSALADRGLVVSRRTEDGECPVVESEALRAVIHAGTPAREAARVHRAIAHYVAERPRLQASSPELAAWHWFHAGIRDAALEPAIAGARKLLANCEFRRGLDLIRIAGDSGAEPLAVARLLFEAYRLWGHYEDGVAALAALLPAEADPAARREVSLLSAELSFRAGDYPRARQAIDALGPDDALPGPALALLARVHFFQGRHQEARATGERGMQALAPEGRDFALCASMVGLARVYEGKLSQGAKYLETALSVLDTAGTASDVAFAANALGLAYHRLKDYENAERFYRRSLDVAVAGGDSERTNVASMNLSVLFQEMGEHGKAIERYREALAMAYRSQNLPVLARIYNNLGNIHRYLGMLQKARDYAERSLAIADRLGQDLMRGLNTMLLGETHTLEGRFQEAEAELARARETFDRLEAADERLECDIDWVELLSAMGRLDAAAEEGARAAETALSLQLDNHHLRITLAWVEALNRRRRGDDLQTARAALDRVAPTLERVGSPELEWKHWALTASVLSAAGSGDAAIAALRRAEAAFSLLRARIPDEYQTVFTRRPDRRRWQEELARATVSVQQLAQTLSPEAGASLLAQPQRPWITALVEMSRRLLSEHSLDRLLETLIDVIVDLSGAERGFVILPSASGMEVVVARNMDGEAIRKSRTKFSTSIARQVLRDGKMVRLSDAIEADDFREAKSVLALKIRSVICLPLKGREGTLGALYLDNRFKPGVFSDGVVEMLGAFADQAAIAIENARLLDNYRRSIEQVEASRQEIERLNRQLEEKVRLQQVLLVQKDEQIDRQQEQLAERHQFESIVGKARPMQSLFSLMRRVKETHVPVLITGESGVGKELVARALHFAGARRAGRFVSINCAALPDTLLESELFGHVKGAFTDASADKKGLFAVADGGTLFMDEVGDMSLSMQAKLLRVLQEGEFSPLGAESAVTADVRVVTATNKDLRKLVKAAQFREDLYYRLDVVTLHVPPLRDRKEDIPLLVDHFLDQYAQKNRLPRPQVSLQAMEVLVSYDWPGNVRELQSAVFTAAVFAEHGTITLESLRAKPEVLSAAPVPRDPLQALDSLDLRGLEKRAILAALARAEGNKLQAARMLGISRRALYNKIDAFGLERLIRKERGEEGE